MKIHSCIKKDDKVATNKALVTLINNIFKRILPTKARCSRRNKMFYGTALSIAPVNQKNMLALMLKVHSPCTMMNDTPNESVPTVTQSVFWSMASKHIFGKDKEVSSNSWTETAVLVNNTTWIRINTLIPQSVRSLDTLAIALWWNVIETSSHHFGDSTTVNRLKKIPASMCTKERGVSRNSKTSLVFKKHKGLKQSKLVLQDGKKRQKKKNKKTPMSTMDIGSDTQIIPLGNIPDYSPVSTNENNVEEMWLFEDELSRQF